MMTVNFLEKAPIADFITDIETALGEKENSLTTQGVANAAVIKTIHSDIKTKFKLLKKSMLHYKEIDTETAFEAVKLSLSSFANAMQLLLNPALDLPGAQVKPFSEALKKLSSSKDQAVSNTLDRLENARTKLANRHAIEQQNTKFRQENLVLKILSSAIKEKDRKIKSILSRYATKCQAYSAEVVDVLQEQVEASPGDLKLHALARLNLDVANADFALEALPPKASESLDDIAAYLFSDVDRERRVPVDPVGVSQVLDLDRDMLGTPMTTLFSAPVSLNLNMAEMGEMISLLEVPLRGSDAEKSVGIKEKSMGRLLRNELVSAMLSNFTQLKELMLEKAHENQVKEMNDLLERILEDIQFFLHPSIHSKTAKRGALEDIVGMFGRYKQKAEDRLNAMPAEVKAGVRYVALLEQKNKSLAGENEQLSKDYQQAFEDYADLQRRYKLAHAILFRMGDYIKAHQMMVEPLVISERMSAIVEKIRSLLQNTSILDDYLGFFRRPPVTIGAEDSDRVSDSAIDDGAPSYIDTDGASMSSEGTSVIASECEQTEAETDVTEEPTPQLPTIESTMNEEEQAEAETDCISTDGSSSSHSTVTEEPSGACFQFPLFSQQRAPAAIARFSVEVRTTVTDLNQEEYVLVDLAGSADRAAPPAYSSRSPK